MIDLRFQKLDYLTNEMSPENVYVLVLENPKFKLSSKNFTGSKSGIFNRNVKISHFSEIFEKNERNGSIENFIPTFTS